MSATEGPAEARPEDHVREFIAQLGHPETQLKTDTRRSADDVWSGTSWGHSGRDAILAELKRTAALETALRGIISHWREFGGMMVYNNAENRDDYGLEERIERTAHLVGM